MGTYCHTGYTVGLSVMSSWPHPGIYYIPAGFHRNFTVTRRKLTDRCHRHNPIHTRHKPHRTAIQTH